MTYITLAEMRTALQYSGTATYADADISRACTAVSTAIDRACGMTRRFSQATETRYYTPDVNWGRWGYSIYSSDCRLEIDDITSASTVTVDTSGNGTYSTTWVEGTDFFFDPPNAALDGMPYTEIVIRRFSGQRFPNVQRAIKITGVFGWPSVPVEVNQYALIFAAQLVMRSRQAPFGILMQGMEVGAMARLMRVDPDFQRLIGPLVKSRPFF